MAILEFDQIKELILSDTPNWVQKVRKYTTKLQVHINGIGVAEYLDQIESFENDTQYNLRQKFATSNKFVFENLLRPVDKVFQAQGGSRIVKTKTESSQEILSTKIKNIKGGYPVRKFIDKLQTNKYYSDPSGIVFFEWLDIDTYPTFKSIYRLKNYQCDGRQLEWILFEPEKRLNEDNKEIVGNFYRFVDDAFDMTFHEIDGKVELLEDEVYPNPWGKVPGFVNSDLWNEDLTYHISPVDSVVDLADHYLRTTSVKNIYEFLHGYPIFWAYVEPCRTCEGIGLYNGDVCPVCNGEGHTFRKDVSDVIKLKPPTTSDEPQLAPNVAGYVEPDINTWEQQRTELDWIWNLMHFSMWGTVQEIAENKTATAAFLDVQPVNDRLNQFADAFEQTEKLMIDYLGQYLIRDNYEGVSVNYGRRFLVESPDKVWEKYLKAKEKGSPKISLDYLLRQFYQSEFQNDIESLVIAEKGINIEPFIHKTDEEINKLPLDEYDKIAKFYFNEWWTQVDETEKLLLDTDKLKVKFNEFIKQKNDARQEAQRIPSEVVQERQTGENGTDR